MRIITVLSGKGGVGKSSITASLSIGISRAKKIILADCDVDAPNLALIFGKKEKDFFEWKDLSINQKAFFDLKRCNSCQKCLNACHFDAIDWTDNKPALKDFSCEGCGVAEVICPAGAISLKNVNSAKIGFVDTGYGFKLVSSQLNIGESGSGKLVAEVKRMAEGLAGDSEIIIVDSAAGIGCPVIASVSGSDLCVLIAEPTPSSFFDLKKALKIVDHFRIRKALIMNKYDINKKYSQKIEEFAVKEKIDLIGRLPYHKDFVKALVDMKPVISSNKEIGSLFKALSVKILDLAK